MLSMREAGATALYTLLGFTATLLHSIGALTCD